MWCLQGGTAELSGHTPSERKYTREIYQLHLLKQMLPIGVGMWRQCVLYWDGANEDWQAANDGEAGGM